VTASARGHDDVGAGEQQQEQRNAGREGFDSPQARKLRPDDKTDLEGDQTDEHHQPDHQRRDGDRG
jgi:hypothetical protein